MKRWSNGHLRLSVIVSAASVDVKVVFRGSVAGRRTYQYDDAIIMTPYKKVGTE